MSLDFISFTIVNSKLLKLVPYFANPLKGTPKLKPNSFLILVISYSYQFLDNNISFMTNMFWHCPISRLLNWDHKFWKTCFGRTNP